MDSTDPQSGSPADVTSSQASTSSAAQPPVPTVIIQQQTSMFGRFGKLLLIALGIALLTIFGLSATYQSYFNPTTGPQEKYHSLSKTATDKIAIITVAGTILEGDGFVKQQIDRVKKDDAVKAVVMYINSPGGTVTGSDYIYHHLRELADENELPIVASMGSICASGGYYIAMAVGDEPDTVFAEPTTWTGSIGVIIPHYDLSGLLEEWSIDEDSISSGRFKQMGSPMRKMTEEERALLQDLVDDSFSGFKDIVKNGRPKYAVDPTRLDAVATGQIFTASQAVKNGLVDQIGFIETAIERAVELAGGDTEDYRCVKYTKQQAPLEALMGTSASEARLGRETWDLASLLDLTTPRAYYLYTWLPSLLNNTKQ